MQGWLGILLLIVCVQADNNHVNMPHLEAWTGFCDGNICHRGICCHEGLHKLPILFLLVGCGPFGFAGQRPVGALVFVLPQQQDMLQHVAYAIYHGDAFDAALNSAASAHTALQFASQACPDQALPVPAALSSHKFDRSWSVQSTR